MGIFLQGFISGIIGILFGVIVLLLLKNIQLLNIISILGHKLTNRNIVVPEQGEL